MASLVPAHAIPSGAQDVVAPEDARWRDAIGATVALWLFVLLIYLPEIVQRHSGEGVRSIALDSSTIFVSMLFALPIFAAFRATMRWRAPPRIALLVSLVVVVAISQAMFDLMFTTWVTRSIERSWVALPVDIKRGYGAAINYLSVFGVNLALFQLGASRRRARRQERRYAAILASGQEAELEALRSRLNPHFLFNTLNSISAMIVTRRTEDADRTVERLAAFLRASYAHDPMTLIPLEDEFAAIEHYARIEETRFRDRIAIVIAPEPGLEGLCVPPLMMQPLVEAVLDAAATARTDFVRIRVAARVEHDRLLIETSQTPVSAAPLETAGVALVRDRLVALFGERGGVTAVDGRVTAWLPANAGEEGA